MACGSSRCVTFSFVRCSSYSPSIFSPTSNTTLQKANGTLLNYIDEPDSFPDTSSTALLAATTFRFASITGDRSHIPAAIRALKLVRDSVDNQGWLLNTVDPLKFSAPSGPGRHSPEGQSFVLLLEAAVSAWQMSYKYKT
jgi:hypothetical protein